MKTLDEVIKGFECCNSINCAECPYANWDNTDVVRCDPTNKDDDALHYLKAFRDAKNALDADREKTIEAYCQWKDAREKLEAQTSLMMWVDKHFQFEISDNPPITWDELKTMEGKPVWVEVDEKYKGWVMVGKFYSFFEYEDVDAHVNLYYFGRSMEYSKEMYGFYWQAYRKERE